MTFSSLLRAFQHELRVLFLDAKLLGTLTLIPCLFLLILAAKGPSAPREYTVLVPLPPQLPNGTDDNLQKLFTYLAAGRGATQEMLAHGVPSAIRDVLLSKSPADEELLEADQAIAEYFRTATAEQREALRQAVEPAKKNPAESAPVEQSAPTADAAPPKPAVWGEQRGRRRALGEARPKLTPNWSKKPKTQPKPTAPKPKSFLQNLSHTTKETPATQPSPAESAPVEQPAPTADAAPPKEVPATQPPPLSDRAIVRRLVVAARADNKWLIDARTKFPDALQAMLKREDALASPLNPTRLAEFRNVLQHYYLGPATEPFANAGEAISGLTEAWGRYTTLAKLLFPDARQRDDFETPSTQLASIYKFIRKVMGDGHVRGVDRRSRLTDALADLAENGTIFYWDGLWKAFVRDSTSAQDNQAQQSRAITLMVLNWYSFVGPGTGIAEQITPDLLYVALDSISQFGEVHLGYDPTVDEHPRAMIILGLFAPVMAFFLASGQIQRDRRYGVLPLVVVATGNRVSVLIAARTVAVLCTTTFIFLIIASVSFLLSGLPTRLPSLPQTAGLMVCLLGATMAGLALSFWIRSERQTYFITAVLILASVLFGGVVESLANAAPLSRLIGYSLPTAAFLAILREWASASVYPMNWLRLAAICWPPVCLGAAAIVISAGSWRQRS
jgi:hypothetical protein